MFFVVLMLWKTGPTYSLSVPLVSECRYTCNVIALPTRSRSDAEELRGSVSVRETSHPSTLSSYRTMQGSEAKNLQLQASPQPALGGREGAAFLSHVKAQNQLISHENEITDRSHFPLAPALKPTACATKFDLEVAQGVLRRSAIIPSGLDLIVKPIKLLGSLQLQILQLTGTVHHKITFCGAFLVVHHRNKLRL
jgi:hypothetical protein